MGLIDDDGVVLRKHVEVLEGVDGEHRVIGDHEVSISRALPGELGEALCRHRALAGADAVDGADRDLLPGPVGDAHRQIVPVPGLGLSGPFPQPEHLLAQ